MSMVDWSVGYLCCNQTLISVIESKLEAGADGVRNGQGNERGFTRFERYYAAGQEISEVARVSSM
jgi:hypothetical protein